MQILVVLAILGCAYASPFLQFTPEVAAERARFAQLFQAQAALAAAAPDDPVAGATHHHQATTHHHHQQPTFNHHHQQPTFNHHQIAGTTKWQGPVAATVPAGLPGAGSQVAETADVAAARDAFLAAYRAQVAATTGHHIAAPAPRQQHNFASAPRQNVISGSPQKWRGPFASTVPAGVNGQITPVGDTAEVAAARNAFFASYNAALSASRPVAAAPQHHRHQSIAFHQPAPVQHAQARWTGPVAATVPAGLPGSSSQVAQTADVARATAAFHQAYNAAVAATTGRRF